MPHDVTPAQLETLLNGLLQQQQGGGQDAERLPYSFFIEDQELAAELGAHLLKQKVCVRRQAAASEGSCRGHLLCCLF